MSDYKHTIEEGNKLIGEFDGWVKQPDFVNSDNDLFPHYKRFANGRYEFIYHHPNKYHSSWDWLMPVVEKINKNNKMVCINFWTDQNTTECKIYNWELGANEQEAECESPIEAVWQAVVAHIQHYNSTQLK